VLNNRVIFSRLLFAGAALLGFSVAALPQSVPGSSAPAPAQSAGPKPKTAAEQFKNIQVLKDVRADQLLPSMRYITVALGVECGFCHVPEHFDSDDKPQKATAREMMKMLFAIDADNFHGRREVTCFTCHQGHSRPMSIPVLPGPETAMAPSIAGMPMGGPRPAGSRENQEMTPGNPAPAASLPKMDDILADYAKALGGPDAIRKIETRSEKGTVEMAARNFHAPMDVFRKAPDMALAILHSPMGDITEGFDGSAGWESRGKRGARPETGDELLRVAEWADFFPALDLKRDYSRAMVNGIEKIDGQDAYRVFAWRKGGGREELYFDVQTGLLVRVDELIDSPLGSLPMETDYHDYRSVDGVKFPFTIRVARMDGATIYKWDQIETNVPLQDGRFAMPPPPPSEGAVQK